MRTCWQQISFPESDVRQKYTIRQATLSSEASATLDYPWHCSFCIFYLLLDSLLSISLSNPKPRLGPKIKELFRSTDFFHPLRQESHRFTKTPKPSIFLSFSPSRSLNLHISRNNTFANMSRAVTKEAAPPTTIWRERNRYGVRRSSGRSSWEKMTPKAPLFSKQFLVVAARGRTDMCTCWSLWKLSPQLAMADDDDPARVP